MGLKFWAKPKEKSPPKLPPTTSLVTSHQSEADINDEISLRAPLEPNCTLTLGSDIWLKILLFCDVLDIIRIGKTSRSLYSTTQSHTVWYHALLRIAHDKRLFSLRRRIPLLPTAILRQKAILAAKLDRAWHDSQSMPSPPAISSLTLPIGISYAWSVAFVPGGEWLAMLCRFGPYNREGLLLCEVNAAPGDQHNSVLLECLHDWNSLEVFTSNTGDPLILLREDHSRMSTLGVCLVNVSTYPPSLDMTFTAEVPQLDGCCSLGNHIACGWTEPTQNPHESSRSPMRHIVGVMKLDPSYRKVEEQCTMEMQYKRPIPQQADTARNGHIADKWSYGLRIDRLSRLTILVSQKVLVAAYRVPTLQPIPSAEEIVPVTPFWSFPCHRLAPRAVYLIPSVPSVDEPSIIIFYRDRCLFLAPDFDTDPPGFHPTYYSTFTAPPSLKSALTLGPHRAFWDLGHGRIRTRALPTPLQPTFYEEESDQWDMTGADALEGDLAVDTRSVTLSEDFHGRLSKATWDEESGRLVVLPAEHWDGKRVGGKRHLFVVDMSQS